MNIFGESKHNLNGTLLAVELSYVFQGYMVNDNGENTSVEPDADSTLAVDGTFVVLYQLDSGPELSDADLTAFAEINGRLNTVPYWREFVSSSLVRAGLPAYEVPVYNPARVARDRAEIDAPDDHPGPQ